MWLRANPAIASHLVVVFLITLGARTAPSMAPQHCPRDESTKELAAQFREIRAVRGHFDGQVWDPDVDAWMGLKHRLMIELADRLSDAGCVEAELVELLGPPDRVAAPDEGRFHELIDRAAAGASVDRLLIYRWRGAHDVLFFKQDGDRILDASWWHAGDD